MKKIWLGFVFFVGLVLLGFSTVVIGNIPWLGKPTEYIILFSDVQGLKEGDDVRVDGYQLGKVHKVYIIPDREGVAVLVTLRDEIKLFNDFRVMVQSLSIVGGSTVMIYRGTKGSGPFQPETLEQRFPEVLDSPLRSYAKTPVLVGISQKGAMEGLADMLQRNSDSVTASVNAIKNVLEKLDKGEGTLPKLINDPTLHNELVEAMKSLRGGIDKASSLLKDVDEGKGNLGKLLKNEDLYDNLKSSLDNFNKATKKLDELVETAKNGKGPLPTLLNDQKMAEDLKASMNSLKETLDNLNKSFTSKNSTIQLLTQDEETRNKVKSTIAGVEKTIGRIGNAKTFIDINTVQHSESDLSVTKIGLQYAPDDTKYLYIGASMWGLEADQSKIQFVEQVNKGKDDRDVFIDGLLAYSPPPLQGKLYVGAGLIEGEFGGRVDFTWDRWGLFNHPVNFMFDARGAKNSLSDDKIDENIDGFNMRLTVTTPFWLHHEKENWVESVLASFRIIGGIDRISSDPEYFFGLGLHWEEPDIKSFLGIAGSAR